MNKTLSFPITKKKRKKLESIAARTKGINMSEVRAFQFALEQVVKRIGALEKQCDGLAKLEKQKDIDINHIEVRLKRFEKRLYRKDEE